MPWDSQTRRRLKLRDLDVLMTVVQMGGMRKAANYLNMSQPAVSKTILNLEHTLGVTLLDRSPHGIEPTEYGRALLHCGAAVFDDLRLGVKNIEFLADPAAGDVRIGSIPPLAATFVPSVVDRLSRRYPRIVFHLTSADTETLLKELHDRSIDLLIGRRHAPIPDERLSFESLFDDTFVVVAGAQHPWVRRRKIELAELANESWVLPPPESTLGSLILQAFRASGLDYPRTTVFTIPAPERISLLATGRFITIFSTSALKFPSRQPELKVLPIELPLARVPVGIVTLKNRSLAPVARLFIDTAREVAKPLAKNKKP
jgi:DNA-binding transcriptional LysR family regulator